MSVVKPFDFFKQESSDPDMITRTDAMAKVALIAALMGAESARRDLIPYLLTKTKDMDQVQLQLAIKTEHLLPYVGGLDHMTSLIPLIEVLLGAEETAVRSAICVSVNHMLEKIEDDSDKHTKISGELLDMTGRLLKDEDEEMFYSRVCICAISGHLYRILTNKDKPVFLEIIKSLLKHDSMVVRAEAAAAFPAIAKHCDKSILTNEVWDTYSLAINDVNLSIRTIAIETLSTFCVLVMGNEDFLTDKILPLVAAAATENAWNLRRAISKNMSVYFKAFLFSKDKALVVLDSYLKLLLDKESEVRQQALEEISSSSSVLINAFGIEVFIERILPVVERLLDDPINAVRKVLAEQSILLAIDIKPDELANPMFRFITALSKDIDPLVKLRIVKNVSLIAERAKDHFLNLTDTVMSFYKDENWRVRKEACFATPLIHKHMGITYFREHILQLYIGLLQDNFDEVRTSCAKSIG